MEMIPSLLLYLLVARYTLLRKYEVLNISLVDFGSTVFVPFILTERDIVVYEKNEFIGENKSIEYFRRKEHARHKQNTIKKKMGY